MYRKAVLQVLQAGSGNVAHIDNKLLENRVIHTLDLLRHDLSFMVNVGDLELASGVYSITPLGRERLDDLLVSAAA